MKKVKEIAKGVWQFVSYLFWPQLDHRKEEQHDN